MKPILAAAAGFTLSLGMFAGGAVLATYTLAAKPVTVASGPAHDVSALWTAQPTSVDPDDQQLERVAAVLPPAQDEVETAEPAMSEVETVTIASADPNAWPQGSGAAGFETAISGEPQDTGLPAPQDDAVRLSAEHAQWCSDRYRSYDARTNSYTPYSGGRRACVSPYAQSAAQPAETGEGVYVQADLQNASPAGRHVAVASRHVQSCFDRYRSYRVEDNSYQPYGGGPRRQCQ